MASRTPSSPPSGALFVPDERFLVVGAGSIGRRHVANLVALGVDVSVCDVAGAEFPGATSRSMDALGSGDFAGVLIATPSRVHVEQAATALAGGARVLVEKPLSTDVDGLQGVVDIDGDRLAVAFNLRLHAPVQRAVELAGSGAIGEMRSVRAWYGQHLADWRPGTDYRASYSASSALGGGILNDASHELDLLVWLLGGDIDVIGAVVDRVGPLEMDAENIVVAVLRAGDLVAQLQLDSLSRRYRRGLEIVGDERTVRLDWARGVLELEDRDGIDVEDASTSVDRSYELEAERFVAWVRDGTPMPVDGRTAAVSVRLADAIRRSAG